MFSTAIYTAPDGPETATQDTTWSSSDPTIANFSSTPGEQEVLFGLRPGTVTVTALNNGFMGNALVKILDIDFLYHAGLPFPPPNQSFMWPWTAISDSGESMVVYGLHSTMYVTGYASPQGAIKTPEAITLPSRTAITMQTVGLAINQQHKRLIMWSDIDGIHYLLSKNGAAFLPLALLPGSNSDVVRLQSLFLREDGTAFALWVQKFSLYESRLDPNTDVWTQPVTIAQYSSPISLAVPAAHYNKAGQVAYAWFTTYPGGSGSADVQLWAARGDFNVSGNRVWSAPTLMTRVTTLKSPTAGMSEAGVAITTWADESDMNNSILNWGSSAAANQAWINKGVIPKSNAKWPTDMHLALAGDGTGILVWGDAYSQGVYAARYTSSTWNTAELIRPGEIGFPTIVSVAADTANRFKLVWTSSTYHAVHGPYRATLYLPDSGPYVSIPAWTTPSHYYESKVYSPGSGWSQQENLDFIGDILGNTHTPELHFNSLGDGIAGWEVSNMIDDGNNGAFFVNYAYSSKYHF